MECIHFMIKLLVETSAGQYFGNIAIFHLTIIVEFLIP